MRTILKLAAISTVLILGTICGLSLRPGKPNSERGASHASQDGQETTERQAISVDGNPTAMRDAVNSTDKKRTESPGSQAHNGDNSKPPQAAGSELDSKTALDSPVASNVIVKPVEPSATLTNRDSIEFVELTTKESKSSAAFYTFVWPGKKQPSPQEIHALAAGKKLISEFGFSI